jgi:hypothetical protein
MNALSSTAPQQIHNQSNLAPIALFVYNRAEHTRRTLEALRRNDLASQSDLFVFSDAAKNDSIVPAVREVRHRLHALKGFRSITIIERDRNYGLANSVVAGVTQLCSEFGRMIALEDDLLTTSDFLTFMNRALERYREEPRVFSVSGFNFALNAAGARQFPYDAFCFYRSSSLGWGTWNDRWEKTDWSISDYHRFHSDKHQQEKFRRGGEDLPRMLRLQMVGKLDSWAIRWAYAHYKHDALALLSLRPRVFHIGGDGSGTYTKWGALRQLPLTSETKSEFTFPDVLEPEAEFILALQRLLRPSLLRKIAHIVRDTAG